MSTHCSIGIQNEDGTVRSIYSHWDGYTSHNGQILADYYDSVEKVNELIDQGSVSVLGAYVGTPHDFDFRPSKVEGTPFASQCTFYRRDRQEYGSTHNAQTHRDRHEFHDDADGPYYYLFVEGKWLVSVNASTWQELNDVLTEED